MNTFLVAVLLFDNINAFSHSFRISNSHNISSSRSISIRVNVLVVEILAAV